MVSEEVEERDFVRQFVQATLAVVAPGAVVSSAPGDGRESRCSDAADQPLDEVRYTSAQTAPLGGSQDVARDAVVDFWRDQGWTVELKEYGEGVEVFGTGSGANAQAIINGTKRYISIVASSRCVTSARAQLP